MSLFNQNNTSGTDDNRLREWGDAERNEPPARRGSFAALVNRLEKSVPAVAPEKPVSWLRPVLAMGLATCVTMAVAVQMLDEQQARDAEREAVEMAQILSQRQNQARYLANRRRNNAANQAKYLANYKREVEAKRNKLSKWSGRALFDFGSGIAARCAPVFVDGDTAMASVGNRGAAVVPLTVAIQNKGAAMDATITVTLGEVGEARVYRYPVRLAGKGAIHRQTLYPRLDAAWENNKYRVTLQTPSKTITLETGKAHLINGGRNYNDGSAGRTVAMLDTRIGVLSARMYGHSTTGIGELYAKPQFAPDRATGYDAVDTLVLGYGCETLSQTQWGAIREWVKNGGSLVMLGGSPEMRRVLATPAALELSPAVSFANETRSRTPHRRVSYFDSGEPLRKGYFLSDHDITDNFPVTMTTIPTLKHDARIVEQSPMLGKEEWANIGARRSLGAGAVTFYGYDVTSDVYRDAPYILPGFWLTSSRKDKGAFPASQWSRNVGNDWYNGSEGSQTSGVSNPFYTRFPDLSLVMYVFLGYFVLVVPVSFVVLKQTRRMNYAWFTAPALAAVCAGGLAFSTRDLYKAPQSVRTSGILALEAGDPVARFHGVSELYTPKAGRYTLSLAGTNQTFGDGEAYSWSEGGRGGGNTFPVDTTTDTGSGENPSVLEMDNLSFKRVRHDQTVTLGTGITASLRADRINNMSGTITNGTGQTLRNVRVYVRGENVATLPGATHLPLWEYHADSLAPGTHSVILGCSRYPRNSTVSQDTSARIFDNDMPQSFAPRTPFLTAKMDGKPFAPQGFGQWVGGNNSVEVIAKLPAVPQAAMPKIDTYMYEGKAKPKVPVATPTHRYSHDTKTEYGETFPPPPPGTPPTGAAPAPLAEGDNR
ncbi:MAG: hypothetical protein H7Y38_10350 [Armatimonadetes bacterium]|nr:hypothetical protein [Armatimonadota bacterium]